MINSREAAAEKEEEEAGAGAGAGPRGRPSTAVTGAEVGVGVEVEKEKKRRRRRKERQRPREKRIAVGRRPETAEGRAAQLAATMMRREVGRRGPVCVIEKTLTKSDADPEQCRLQLAPGLVAGLKAPGLLAEDEAAVLSKPEAAGLELRAADREGNEYGMKLKFSGSVGQYRIMRCWAQFCVDHDLREGQKVAIWVYRMPPEKADKAGRGGGGKLGMILLCYDEGDEEQEWMDARLLEPLVLDSLQALLKFKKSAGA